MATQQSRCKSPPLALWKIDSVVNRFVGVLRSGLSHGWDVRRRHWHRPDPYGHNKIRLLSIRLRSNRVWNRWSCRNSGGCNNYNHGFIWKSLLILWLNLKELLITTHPPKQVHIISSFRYSGFYSTRLIRVFRECWKLTTVGISKWLDL